jgi:hypothetical protein
MRFAVSLAFMLAMVWLASPPQVAAASCSGWTSSSTPPSSIRVYRTHLGRIDQVNFRTYVYRVVAKEWGDARYELLRAGGMAVKQYAWYRVLHHRSTYWHNGHCYDIKDSTADQLYKTDVTITTNQVNAVDSMWSAHLEQNSLFLSQYALGYRTLCASDAGRRLYERSARDCVRRGWSAERILQRYYNANIVWSFTGKVAVPPTYGPAII